MSPKQKICSAAALLAFAVALAIALLTAVNRRVSGEMFTHDPLAKMQMQAGAVIYVISEQEGLNEMARIEAERKNLATPPARTTNSLIKFFREADPDNTQSDIEVLLEVGSKYPHKLAEYPDAKAQYDELQQTITDAFSPKPPFGSTLKWERSVVADSAGRFELKLNRWRNYYLVTQATVGRAKGTRWCVKISADQSKAILSDGNALPSF